MVHHLARERADALVAEGLFADDLPGIATAASRLRARWGGTVARARALPGDQVDVRVEGEWSFVETLRHLLFVQDLWVGEVIEEQPSPHHPLGVPPDFLPAEVATAMGLTVDERPSLDEVVLLHEARWDQAERVIAGLTADDLARTCASRGGQFQVVGALQVVLFEEWAHLQYATRDLTTLEEAADR